MKAIGVGTVLAGRYELLDLLGRGGFGTVWRVLHQDLGQELALKVLNPEVAQSEDARARFLREVKTSTAFVHPYSIQVRDFGRDPEWDCLYYTMDLVEGRTLAELLKEQPLRPERAVRLVGQVLEVLEAAHGRGIVHRDLKPANLLVTRDPKGHEEVRVLDFGIAKAVSDAGAGTSALTLSGMTIGTLSYMSPEQARGSKLDGRSDLYSLGVVLFEALSGHLPIQADPDAEDPQRSLLFNLTMTPPRELSKLRPDLPEALCAVVMQALAKTAKERHADAAAMARALRSIPGETLSLRPTGSAPAGLDTLSERPTGSSPASPDTLSGAPTGSSPTTGSGSHTASWGKTAGAPQAQPSAFPPTLVEPLASRAGGPGRVAVGALALLLLTGGVALALDLGGLRGQLVGRSAEEPKTDAPQTETGERPGKTGPETGERPGKTGPKTEKRPGKTGPKTGERPRPRGPRFVDLSPKDGDATRAVSVRVAGRVEGAAGGEVRINGLKRTLDRTGRFVLEGLGLQPGPNRVTLVAQPTGGASVETILTIHRDRDPPRLELTGPVEGLKLFEDRVVVAGRALDPTLGTVLVEGQAASIGEGGSFTYTLALPRPGERRIEVVARDRAGNETPATRRIVRLPPRIETTPRWTRLKRVDLAVELRPPRAGELRVEGRGVFPLPASGKLVVRGLELKEGPNQLRLTAQVQGLGKIGARAVVTRDTQPPRLTLAKPLTRVDHGTKTLTLTGEVRDDAWPVEVRVTPGDQRVRVERGEALRVLVPLREGPNRIKLQPIDAAGNRGRASELTVVREAPDDYQRLVMRTAKDRTLRYLDRRRYASGGQRQRIARFTHRKTGLVLCLIPGGSSRETRIRPFLIAQTECTQAAWKRVMGTHPSNWKGDDLPVERVSWTDAQAFCQKSGLRLPSEAEWELACRAGTRTAFSFGDEEGRLGEHGWYSGNSGNRTHPVGQKKPNAFGLFDVHGNVWEWVEDRFKAGAADRVNRGGGWNSGARLCRSGLRNRSAPSYRYDALGFRPARSLP